MSTSRRRWLVPGLLTAAGVLGFQNGIWSYFTEPMLLRLRDFALNLMTLGVETYKDALYLHIAKGYHEHIAEQVLLGMTFLMIIAFMVYALLMFEVLRRLRLRHTPGYIPPVDHMFDRLFRISRPHRPEDSPKILTIARTAVYVNLVILIFAGAQAFSAGISASYINNAIAHYQQLRAIAAPDLDQPTLLRYDARFAGITKGADYKGIVKDLQTYLTAQKKPYPKFTPW